MYVKSVGGLEMNRRNKIGHFCVETTAYISAWKNSRHEMIVAESSQRLRQIPTPNERTKEFILS